MRDMWIQPLDSVPYKAGQADKDAIHIQWHMPLLNDLVSVNGESIHPTHELISPSSDNASTGCSSVISMDQLIIQS